RGQRGREDASGPARARRRDADDGDDREDGEEEREAAALGGEPAARGVRSPEAEEEENRRGAERRGAGDQRERSRRPLARVLAEAVELERGERRRAQRNPLVKTERQHLADRRNPGERLDDRPGPRRGGDPEAGDDGAGGDRRRAPSSGPEREEREHPG